jgi:hypothetical protein
MSIPIVRYGTNPPHSMQIAPTVVVSSGGDLSKKHLKPDSRLQPLATDTFELSKKHKNTLTTQPSFLQRLGKA